MNETEKGEYRIIAEQCEALARRFHALEDGTIKAHTDDAKMVGVMSRNLIRMLVSDWM